MAGASDLDMAKIQRAKATGAFEVLERRFRTQGAGDRCKEIGAEVDIIPGRFKVLVFVSLDATDILRPESRNHDVVRVDPLVNLGPATYLLGLVYVGET